MKKIFTAICLVMLAAWQLSCSKNEPAPAPEPEPIHLNKDTVTALLSRHSFLVTDAWRFSGKDSVDMFQEDTLLKLYANAAFLHFYISNGQGQIMFHGGTKTPNTEIEGNAWTYSLNVRIYYPTQMDVNWNEETGTLGVEAMRESTYFPMIIPGKKGYLDPAGFNIGMSFDQAKKAAVKPSMRFIYEDDDPRLGKVTYKITMKPMYRYKTDPVVPTYADFAVFP